LFEIQTQEQADRFTEDFGNTELGEKLMKAYNQSTANPLFFQELGNLPYFTEKLTEEMLEERYEEGRKEERAKVLANLQNLGLLTSEQMAELLATLD